MVIQISTDAKRRNSEVSANLAFFQYFHLGLKMNGIINISTQEHFEIEISHGRTRLAVLALQQNEF